MNKFSYLLQHNIDSRRRLRMINLFARFRWTRWNGRLFIKKQKYPNRVIRAFNRADTAARKKSNNKKSSPDILVLISLTCEATEMEVVKPFHRPSTLGDLVWCWMCKSFCWGLYVRKFNKFLSTSLSLNFPPFFDFESFKFVLHISAEWWCCRAHTSVVEWKFLFCCILFTFAEKVAKNWRYHGERFVHIRILDISSYSVLCERQQKGITDFPFVLFTLYGFFWSLALSRLLVNIRADHRQDRVRGEVAETRIKKKK